MARSEFAIPVADKVQAKKLIEEFLLSKKAKEVVYRSETVWQFGNVLVGKKYLKVEYGNSEVKIYGWVPVSTSGGEMDLTGAINWAPKAELRKIIEQIEELLKTKCEKRNIIDQFEDLFKTKCEKNIQKPNNSQSVDTLLKEAQEYDKNKNYDLSFLLYLKAAELGNAFAQNQVGYAYMFGEGTGKDYTKAVYWLEKSAAQNQVNAFNNLGFCYSNGYGVTQDKHKALECYQKAADLGSKKALENIENIKKYLENNAPKPNDSKTVDVLLNEALEYDKVKKYDKSFYLYLKAAELGNAFAQNQVGYAYMLGEGTGKDYTKAIYWLEKSAAQNNPHAFNNLGFCYSNGYGVTQDKHKALECYEKAAALGSKQALENIESVKRELGIHTQDIEQAKKLYKEAIGYRTIPSKRDFAKSYELFLKSANMGYVSAVYEVGYCYSQGWGVQKDYNRALEWYMKAAEQGYVDAKRTIGMMYQRGEGVAQDYAKAREWYQKAIDAGDKRAGEWILELGDAGVNKNVDSVKNPVENSFSGLEELETLIGLDTVKQDVKEMIQLLEYQKKRKELNKKTSPISMHMVFTGNPGTGKTTVARIIAKIYHELGLLEKAEIVEVDRGDLVADYIGQTAGKTKKKIEEAMGGVLFIDEAYTLVKTGSEKDYGQEAIDTLLKAMEDYRDKLMVIVAGYTEEMHQFINSNPGLKSRFKKVLHFEDYNAEQLSSIFYKLAKEDEYNVDDSANEVVFRYFEKVYRTRGTRFGNGRDVRNFYQDVLTKHVVRVARENDMNDDNISKEDIEAVIETKKNSEKSALNRLNEMIGLENVKKEVNELMRLAKYQKMCQDNNIETSPVSMHMVFTGNPGTGKTTVARLIGEIYHEIGFLSKQDCVEADRSMMVGKYIGHTAIKTKEVIDRAMGGVLFIDEAYTLSSRGGSDFGQEAIDTLLKEMEDHREGLVVIAAGYKDEMKDFIESNPGLKSRFTKTIHFDDYKADELEQIFNKMAKNYIISEEAQVELHRIFEKMSSQKTEHFGNGRDVRNFYEMVVSKLAFRISGLLDCSDTELILITEEDVIAAEGDYFRNDGNNKKPHIGFRL